MSEIAELIRIMDEEAACYRQFLEVAAAKRDAILTKAMDRIVELQGAEQKLVEQVAVLETQRQQVVRLVCGSFGIEVQNGYVSELIKRLGPEAAVLKEKADALRVLIEELQRVNDSNLTLIQQNIEVLEGVLTVVKSHSASRSPYDNKGNRSSVSMILDKKG